MHPALEDSTTGEPLAQQPSPPPVVPELSLLMVHLLKGVIVRDDDERLWASLLRLQARVREQAAVLLLDLVLDEAEGHAFLKSRPDADETDAAGPFEAAPRLPRLVARRPLSYPVSLMLALLRRRLAEFDAAGGDTRLVLKRDEIAEMVRVFLPEGSNEARLSDQVDATLSKVVDLGFLRRLKPTAGSVQAMGSAGGKPPGRGKAADKASEVAGFKSGEGSRDQGPYEVRRILKAFVDAQWLATFDARLEAYRTALSDGKAGRAAAAEPPGV
jgi:hypothetical protein